MKTNYFLKYFIYLFLERGREREREGEKHQCVVASCMPPTGDPAFNPGMCPKWESNRRPFVSQSGPQSTEPHQPGQIFIFLKSIKFRQSSNSSLPEECSFFPLLTSIFPKQYGVFPFFLWAHWQWDKISSLTVVVAMASEEWVSSAAVTGRSYGFLAVWEMDTVLPGDRCVKGHSGGGESLAPRKGRMEV